MSFVFPNSLGFNILIYDSHINKKFRDFFIFSILHFGNFSKFSWGLELYARVRLLLQANGLISFNLQDLWK